MYAKFKGKIISLTPPSAGQGYERLMGGRAFLHGETPQSELVDVMDVGLRLNTLAETVAKNFIGRTELTQAIALSLAIGEHLFVYGEPGTAKSSVLRLFAEGIGGNFWRIVMNPDLPRDEIVGALDPQALAQGQWLRKWAGFATADVAFLDEIWKASPQVVNILLDGLEERRVSSGGQDRHIPLLSAMSASNEIPDRQESQAAYDRFLIRVVTDYVGLDDFQTMLLASAGGRPLAVHVSSDEVRLLAAAAEVLAANPPQELLQTLIAIRRHLNGQGISDRRWRKYLKAACGQCLLRGSIAPLPLDLAVGQWILWSLADEQKDISQAVLGLCDPAAGEVLSLEGLLGDLQRELSNLPQAEASKRDSLRIEAGGKASRLKKKAADLLQSGQANDYFHRLTHLKEKCQDIIENVYQA